MKHPLLRSVLAACALIACAASASAQTIPEMSPLVYGSDPEPTQALLWMTLAPEPSICLLGAVGLLSVLHRRRG